LEIIWKIESLTLIFVVMEEKVIQLTEQEKTWIKALAEGKTTQEVAKESGLASGTFAYKMNNLRGKCGGAKNMAALIAFVYENKLIE
jgi:DNA-binding NarL/FixJ family response regulator